MLDRRTTLRAAGAAAAALLAGPGWGQAANQWFSLTGDDGAPVPNLRLPIELVEDAEDLPGAVWGGPASAAVTLIEFYDFNCPWCRAAAAGIGDLLRQRGDLRVGLVNNPILSPGSAQAAKVELALLKLSGAAAAHALQARLYAGTGRIDGTKALDAAAALGHDRAAVEAAADGEDVRTILARQMRLARSAGLVATPSFVVAGAAILGYPGPKTLARVVANAKLCGTVSC